MLSILPLLQLAFSTSMQVENQKAIDNALFKKLEDISIKMPSDPILYKPDVDKYMDMFKIEFDKVQGDTMKKSQRFGELLIFLARAVKYFPEKLGWVPTSVMQLMQQLGPSLHSYIRKKCAGSIMILRAKNILLPVSTVQFLLKQMRLEDKSLRSMIYKYVLNDIRRMNKHHQNNKINQQIRAFISGYIPKHTDKTAQKSLKLLIQLYKRNVWMDNRTVNIIAEACFAPSARLRLMACYFLMDTTMHLEELPDSEDQLPNPSDIKKKKGITKDTRYKDKQLEKEKRKAGRRLRKRQIEGRKTNFMPIDLIYNPQVFVEKLFNIMSGKQEKYESKLIYMALIARIIWHHKLILLPFYRSLIKYLDPKQKDVPRVLLALAESIHEIVPEDEIETIVKHIIEHFVNDRCSEFTMTLGLNTLRQIFKKLPSIITEQMMLYLCTYYEYRNKNVSRAAKSVINFVRDYNSALLGKKFRGKHQMEDDEEDAQKDKQNNNRIPGVDLLPSNGKIPLEMDRILTDDDFRKIKRLMKKKEEDEQWGNKVDNQIQSDENQEEEEDNEEIDQEVEEDEEEGEGEQEEGQEGEQEEGEDGDEVLEFDSDQIEQLQVEDDLQKDGEQLAEGAQDQGYDSSDNYGQMQEGSEIQFQFEEEEKRSNQKLKKTKQIKKQDKNQKGLKVSNIDIEDSEQEQQQDESEREMNPHGFIASNQIAYYKMSKGELKREKKTVKQGKEQFKHTPKVKNGGTTNREKNKLKPLMMVRSKKNKIRKDQKQLKLRIKSLKNQLGKVRSGKQAKKMKNKKVVKKVKK